MTDQIHAKRKIEKEITKRRIREIGAETWLIVCEGEKTEPNYFKKLKEFVDKELGERFKLKFRVEGHGRNTQSLVKSVKNFDNFWDNTAKCKRETDIPYAKTFVVFDMDSFTPQAFNNAVNMAISKGYIPIWSNECFELWYLFHFEYLDGDVGREKYYEMLNEKFKEKYNCGYEKSFAGNFDLIHSKETIQNAIRNAKNSLEKHDCNTTTPSKCTTCTQMFKFIEILEDEIRSQTGIENFFTRKTDT